jgi:hypothetical protein
VSALAVLTPREASIFACLVDTVVAPAPPLPPVAATDAVPAFDAWLARAPRANRIALRAVLYGLEVGPRLAGFGDRLRRLDATRRLAYFERLEHTRARAARSIAEVLRSTAASSYYGDTAVMRTLGYDAAERVARGRALRSARRSAS